MRSSSPNKASPRRSGTVTRALRLSPRDWSDVAIAVTELAFARVRLWWTKPDLLLRRDDPTNPGAGAAASDRVDRVRVAIARASHRLPWRSDCLVQALAARHWLSRHGVPTRLSLGVPPARRSGFEAHAWLTHEGRVITGGDISGHVPLDPMAGPDPSE